MKWGSMHDGTNEQVDEEAISWARFCTASRILVCFDEFSLERADV